MHSRLRNIALGTLLLGLPMSGIRVICIESPKQMSAAEHPATPAGEVATATESESRPLTDCERLCPFHPPASVQSPDTQVSSASAGEESECALSSDGAALTMLGNIAVLRTQTPLVIPDVIAVVAAERPLFYTEPALAHLAPPPKHQAL